jgi:hypothetical protein
MGISSRKCTPTNNKSKAPTTEDTEITEKG